MWNDQSRVRRAGVSARLDKHAKFEDRRNDQCQYQSRYRPTHCLVDSVVLLMTHLDRLQRLVGSEFDAQWGHSGPRDGDVAMRGGHEGHDDDYGVEMTRSLSVSIDLATPMPRPASSCRQRILA